MPPNPYSTNTASLTNQTTCTYLHHFVTIQYCPAQHNTAQPNTAQPNSTQHDTTRHSATRHDTTLHQHNHGASMPTDICITIVYRYYRTSKQHGCLSLSLSFFGRRRFHFRFDSIRFCSVHFSISSAKREESIDMPYFILYILYILDNAHTHVKQCYY